MSLVGDQQDNWRGSYDKSIAHDRRNDEPDVSRGRDFRAPCSICGSNERDRRRFLICHTAQERDAAYRARMGW